MVCAHCRALVDLTTPAHAVLDVIADAAFAHPLRVGMRGTLRGVACQIAGHVRYGQQDYHWDEYLLVSDDGRTVWLEYDDGFTLYRPFVPTTMEPVHAHTRELVADGTRSAVTERESAFIAHVSGELPFVARVGSPITYVDAHALSVEISETELEWFRVSPMTKAEVAQTFAVPYGELASRCYRLDDDGREVRGAFASSSRSSGRRVPSLAIAVPLFILVSGMMSLFVCLMCAGLLLPDQDSYGVRDRGGGHRTYGGYSGGK